MHQTAVKHRDDLPDFISARSEANTFANDLIDDGYTIISISLSRVVVGPPDVYEIIVTGEKDVPNGI